MQVGFIASLKNEKTHKVVQQVSEGLTVVNYLAPQE